MLNMFMIESTVCHENEQIMNSEECNALDTTSAAMMLFNNGYVAMMDTSMMMDNSLQVTIQPSTAKP